MLLPRLSNRLGSMPLRCLALHCLTLPLLAGAMLLPILRFSWLCPCYTVPRFALAHLFCALPLLGYESVTIVILKNTEVKSKWIRKRKFGVLHKRRGFVLCVSHK